MPYVGLKFTTVGRNKLPGNSDSLRLKSSFYTPIVIFKKAIMLIESVSIDNIHYIIFITLNIITLLFS